MAKRVPDDLNQQLLAALAAQPQGMSIEALVTQFQAIASKRTIQRRLADLIAAKRIEPEKQARALQYKLAPITGSVTAIEQLDEMRSQGKIDIPLSPSGAEVRSLISHSITERIPVGYQREFLDDYRPNTSAYLTPEIRQHLYRLGKTPQMAQPAGTYARQILQRLLIDLAWASSRLEGNTYSLLETEKLVELGQMAEGKNAAETQMILNHKAAIEFLVDTADQINLNPMILRNLHALLADNLLPNPIACGQLRTNPVSIGGSVYHPLEVGLLIQENFKQILATANAITDPFEQAFFLMVHLPYLQPFDDVNKRVSRLSANIPLMKHNLCPLSFVDVPESAYIDGILGVYELN